MIAPVKKKPHLRRANYHKGVFFKFVATLSQAHKKFMSLYLKVKITFCRNVANVAAVSNHKSL